MVPASVSPTRCPPRRRPHCRRGEGYRRLPATPTSGRPGSRLTSPRPRRRLKTRVAVEAGRPRRPCPAAGPGHRHRDRGHDYKQERRGCPGRATRHRQIDTPRCRLRVGVAFERVTYDAVSDGAFPLITNDRTLSGTQVPAGYRYQPNVEPRYHLLKSVQHAAPVLLKNPARIKALSFSQSLSQRVPAPVLTDQQRPGTYLARPLPSTPSNRKSPR